MPAILRALLPLAIAIAWLPLMQFAAADEPDFARDIRPLLTAYCLKCHGADKQESDLRLDTRAGALKGGTGGAVLSPGKPDESELVARLVHTDPEERMPPKAEPLPPAQIELVRRWIAAGLQTTLAV